MEAKDMTEHIGEHEVELGKPKALSVVEFRGELMRKYECPCGDIVVLCAEGYVTL